MTRISMVSRINVNRIRQGKLNRFQFNASAEECAGLADRFGFLGVNSLRAEIEIHKSERECWDVSGRLIGEVVQACGVTGAPVRETVDFLIEERYVRSSGEHSEVEVGLDGEEPLQDDNIEVGEMLAQLLAVSVTAWPRAVDALERFTTDEKASDHPFDGLAVLRGRRPE
jgi:hypothetical protein